MKSVSPFVYVPLAKPTIISPPRPFKIIVIILQHVRYSSLSSTLEDFFLPVRFHGWNRKIRSFFSSFTWEREREREDKGINYGWISPMVFKRVDYPHSKSCTQTDSRKERMFYTDNLSPLSRVGGITSDSYNHGGMGFSAVSKCNPNFSLHRSISKMIIKLMIFVLKGAITSKLLFFFWVIDHA